MAGELTHIPHFPPALYVFWPTRVDIMWLVLGHKEKSALEVSAAKLV